MRHAVLCGQQLWHPLPAAEVPKVGSSPRKGRLTRPYFELIFLLMIDLDSGRLEIAAGFMEEGKGFIEE